MTGFASFRRLLRKGRPGAAGCGVRAGSADAVNVVRVKGSGPLRLRPTIAFDANREELARRDRAIGPALDVARQSDTRIAITGERSCQRTRGSANPQRERR